VPRRSFFLGQFAGITVLYAVSAALAAAVLPA